MLLFILKSLDFVKSAEKLRKAAAEIWLRRYLNFRRIVEFQIGKTRWHRHFVGTDFHVCPLERPLQDFENHIFLCGGQTFARAFFVEKFKLF